MLKESRTIKMMRKMPESRVMMTLLLLLTRLSLMGTRA
jgi:hypothetical protein